MPGTPPRNSGMSNRPVEQRLTLSLSTVLWLVLGVPLLILLYEKVEIKVKVKSMKI